MDMTVFASDVATDAQLAQKPSAAHSPCHWCDIPSFASAAGLLSCSPGQTGPGPSWDGTLLVGDHNQLTNKPLAQKLYGCVRAQLLHASLFMTPQTVARQAPLPMRFSRQEYWSGSPCPPPGDLPNPEFELRPPTSKTDSLLLSHWGSPLRFNTQFKRCCPRTVEV